jgi:2-methylcitrate dehydratase PrpD
MYTAPQDALQAKFSLEFGLAILLLTGDCRLSDFTDEVARRQDLRGVYQRIERCPVDKAEGEFPTEVEVALSDGRTVATSVPMPVGSLAAPFSLRQYWTKFEGCVSALLSDEAAADLRTRLERLPELASIDLLMAPLLGPFRLQ